jgi:hypothetical protein
MSDYLKLAYDTKWLEYKRKLCAATSSHDTFDLLLSGYIQHEQHEQLEQHEQHEHHEQHEQQEQHEQHENMNNMIIMNNMNSMNSMNNMYNMNNNNNNNNNNSYELSMKRNDRFADTLKDMNFNQCKTDPDVWFQSMKTHYEYVCVYVDDIMLIGKDPKSFFDALTTIYNYKLKGVGKPVYHLGGDFSQDDDGTLAWGAASHANKMLNNYKLIFGCEPKPCGTLLVKKYHPELDTSPERDHVGIKQYQSLIGALQWLVTLGNFYIQCAVATMVYTPMPRKHYDTTCPLLLAMKHGFLLMLMLILCTVKLLDAPCLVHYTSSIKHRSNGS